MLLLLLAESVLDLDPLDVVLLLVLLVVLKKSNGGDLPTLSRSEGLNRPERLDISPPLIWAGV